MSAAKDEVRAVDDISFQIYEGETFGLVGESGRGSQRLVERSFDWIIQRQEKSCLMDKMSWKSKAKKI